MYYEKYTEPIFGRAGRGVGPTQEDRAPAVALPAPTRLPTAGLIDINMETSEPGLAFPTFSRLGFLFPDGKF